jgi:uncharacterized membrane protein (DUF373 family)
VRNRDYLGGDSSRSERTCQIEVAQDGLITSLGKNREVGHIDSAAGPLQPPPAFDGVGSHRPLQDNARHWPQRRTIHRGTPHLMRPLVWAEDLLHYTVSAVLIIAAFVVLCRSVYTSVVHPGPFVTALPTLIDNVLFVIIVLEIFTTVLSHFRDGGLQLKPFLIIGIISAVRHILVVGAHSSLGETNEEFKRTTIELGVDVGIAVLLVMALVLVHRSGIRRETE